MTQLMLVTRALALSGAHRQQLDRAQLLRTLATGRTHPGAVVMWPPSYAATIRVVDLLDHSPGLDGKSAAAVLHASGVEPLAELRELSHQDRVAIVRTLREQHPRLFRSWGDLNPHKEAE